MTTYRLYFHPILDTDFVTSVYGNNEEPLSVTTTTSFYQNAFGGLTAASVNPLLLDLYSDLEYDSYVTIGLTGPADQLAGENDASTVVSPFQNWGLGFDPGGGAAGGDLIIDDEVGGAYYIFNGDANGYADEDGRVLLGQFTTDGEIGGTVNVQVLPGPSGVFDVYTLPVATTCSGGDLCIYPDENYDCDGECINDADADGICDEDEVPGCTDSDACNYSADATDDDGSCAVLDECGDCGGDGIAPGACNCAGDVDDALGVCGGDCAADANDNGICDDEEDCLGTVDACGVCDGPGAIYDCGCADIPAGDCDCDGNQLDALDVCGGDCAADENNNGVCDSDETIGCTDPDACNYDPDAIDGPVGSDDEACMELEVFAEHTEGDLAGMTTYRLY
ncbi:MAG TPA: hypothetical protein EYP98_05215, partial [Planctomycetes bacterium]|nr:hypothetical protein [Planctomycetota bacterium]